jgi:hypothetical protein
MQKILIRWILAECARRARSVALQFQRHMQFDAHSARALSRRVHSVQDCLFVIKQTVMQAAQAGEFEVSVALSDALPVVAGQSTNNAAFVIDFLQRHGREAWAEAAAQAVRAGYAVRPAWGRSATGAALEGLTLSWKSLDEDDARSGHAGTPLLMPALQAQAMSQAEQAHVRWVESQQELLQRAARQGKTSVALHDSATPAAAPAWGKRQEILRRAGFNAELIPSEAGATLVVRW